MAILSGICSAFRGWWTRLVILYRSSVSSGGGGGGNARVLNDDENKRLSSGPPLGRAEVLSSCLDCMVAEKRSPIAAYTATVATEANKLSSQTRG